MKYKISEVQELVTKTGKPFFKCTLTEIGGQYPKTEPRVTVWEDSPLFSSIKNDAEIDGYIKKEDSGTPIPAHPNKNYINRTLLPSDSAPAGSSSKSSGCNCNERLAKLEKKVFGSASSSDEINAEDIPF